jgi:hypothetical protein
MPFGVASRGHQELNSLLGRRPAGSRPRRIARLALRAFATAFGPRRSAIEAIRHYCCAPTLSRLHALKPWFLPSHPPSRCRFDISRTGHVPRAPVSRVSLFRTRREESQENAKLSFLVTSRGVSLSKGDRNWLLSNTFLKSD